jgi:hypothetical protein
VLPTSQRNTSAFLLAALAKLFLGIDLAAV